jgi:hypothetical protein
VKISFKISDSRESLIELLNKVKGLLIKHNNMSFDGLSPAEIGMDLGIVIEQLQNGERIDKEYLKALFAPTAPIQECAIANDWSDEYLRLSSEFDDLIAL